ncbi:beta-N-acetylhexosaminidase [Chthonobacter rhizosphaerae]|uniref:beta-N-acetylhexosaminidase n=1 Tax=Chthonobacter rhizosphaerae TaxID=2735553 RepID=UPI0015EEDB88|nr:beta-N-acetylhexosaminidase [Chthonobacter rhizosphaerae]
MPRAFITGVSGPALTDAERRFIADADPWGLILFRRNVGAPDEVRRLTDDFRAAVGWAAPVLVDQEGGRVQRLTAPHWRKYPSARRLLEAASGDLTLVRDAARAMAADLRAAGITVDCAPCLDLGLPGQSTVIGDRAFSGDPAVVTAAGRAAAVGFLAGGVLPVIKHMPGHGRALVDSHHHLPVVEAAYDDLAALDFAPFMALADLPAAMTAHIVYTAIDPDRPATQSPIVIDEIIRGVIGFDGLLLSDDVSMNALEGAVGLRAERSLTAGCDIALHCNGLMDEMEAVAAVAPVLAGPALERATRALSAIAEPDTVDLEAIHARLDRALAEATDAGI